ncbi:ABC-2 type transport system ATP-binding protein [Nocardiopsis sp. Huas11]|uniref:ABC transporter ATP-binding protein n=1 Tax=Nocardiopsis sp. Huas11 TaxID=2183912 RepID=UPI000EB24966|nr:ABC transporter ATP-binding protein [Nocardiopsis sp. Huas11]RKS04693.1 ABC-2 type transport system ATP-binding protein [Nocardiopsis sp. Huas11]
MPIIDVKNLHKRYGDKVVLQDVSFSVEEGEIFGILGPNGAGKTTTVECVEGLRVPDRGTISVLGLDPRRDRAELRENLGAQLQESALPGRLRAGEALRLYASFYRESADPDELTTGLDPQARRTTWDLIERVRDSGVTIVLVTHFMDEAERLCDRLALVDEGRIAALDTPGGLVARARLEQRISFRAPRDLDERPLSALPEVTSVHRTGTQVRITGQGNLVYAVTSALARDHVIAQDLRVEHASLDEAFVTLTGNGLRS